MNVIRRISSCLVNTKISSSANRFADPTVTWITSSYYYWGFLSFHTSWGLYLYSRSWNFVGLTDCPHWSFVLVFMSPYDNSEKYLKITHKLLPTNTKFSPDCTQPVNNLHIYHQHSCSPALNTFNGWQNNINGGKLQSAVHDDLLMSGAEGMSLSSWVLTGIRLTRNVTFAAWFRQIPKFFLSPLMSPVAVRF